MELGTVGFAMFVVLVEGVDRMFYGRAQRRKKAREAKAKARAAWENSLRSKTTTDEELRVLNKLLLRDQLDNPGN